jgi:hypothetical protein
MVFDANFQGRKEMSRIGRRNRRNKTLNWTSGYTNANSEAMAIV